MRSELRISCQFAIMWNLQPGELVPKIIVVADITKIATLFEDRLQHDDK